MELRINTKGVGGKLPNFGFVVFDDSEPVQRILAAKVEATCTRTIVVDILTFLTERFCLFLFTAHHVSKRGASQRGGEENESHA